jgi:hypothetical protein
VGHLLQTDQEDHPPTIDLNKNKTGLVNVTLDDDEVIFRRGGYP